LSRFIAPESHRLFYMVCQKAAVSEGFRGCELQFLRDDGAHFFGRLDFAPEPERNGAEAQYRVSVVDITEKKEAEQQRLQLEQEVLKSQKEDSLKRLAGGIAHNFNNLLTIIMGDIELLRNSTRPISQQNDDLSRAYAASEKAAELSKMMLSYLGYPLSRSIPLELATTVESLVRVIRSTVRGHVNIVLEGGDGAATVMGDPVQIAQILNNLVENSLEAIGSRPGTVIIRVLQRSFRAWETPFAGNGEKMSPGDFVCIEVQDDGCGMDSGTVEKAIDPFFTTNFTGRGLGLSAAWGIARAHGGYLCIDSEPGRGTTVQVYLPVIAPSFESVEETPAEPQPEPVPAAESGARLILYADDDPIVRAIGRMMLESEGYRVIEAGGGEEAVELFARYRGDICCVVLDYAMPDMDGNLALVEIRKIQPQTPALVVSGFLKEQAVDGFLTEKPNGFLQKPFHRDEFLRAIGEILPVGDRPALPGY